MVLPLQETKTSPVYLGVLNSLRQIIPHLGETFLMEEIMRGSFGVHKSLTGDSSAEHRGVNLKQLLQVLIVTMI